MNISETQEKPAFQETTTGAILDMNKPVTAITLKDYLQECRVARYEETGDKALLNPPKFITHADLHRCIENGWFFAHPTCYIDNNHVAGTIGLSVPDAMTVCQYGRSKHGKGVDLLILLRNEDT